MKKAIGPHKRAGRRRRRGKAVAIVVMMVMFALLSSMNTRTIQQPGKWDQPTRSDLAVARNEYRLAGGPYGDAGNLLKLAKFQGYQKKLEGVCDANGLVASFKCSAYPISLTITACSGIGEQLDMLANADDGRMMSTEAKLVFTMEDGDVSFQFCEDINIGDNLFTKLRNLFKNMVRCWEGHFFREVVERELIKAERLPSPAASAAELEGGEDIDYDEDYDDDQEDGEDFPDLSVLDDGPPEDGGENPKEELDERLEALYEQAVAILKETGTASNSLLQRRLKISYSDANKLMDALEARGVVGPYNGSGPREVIGAVQTTEAEEE